VVSRSQVLKEIDERKRAERELRKASITQTNLEMEAESLRQQLAQRPEPEVIEREVEVVREVVPEDVQKRINSLERENRRLNDEYQQMWRKKREADAKLDQANELLGEKERNDNAQRDIEHLTVATNTYLRNYGGKAWAFDQFYRVDEPTQQEFIKAITNLAAFAQGIEQLISDKTNLEA
jgi:chromosome segregation ATPase